MEIYLGDDNRNKPVEFWKGSARIPRVSLRGSDIEALEQRLVNSNTDEPDTVVEQGIQKIDSVKDNDEEEDHTKECDGDAGNSDEELADKGLADDKIDDERVYLGMRATTGHWELKCKTMPSNYGQSGPYTLDIFSAPCRHSYQVFGRFNLGEFKGTIQLARGGNSADRSEYYLDQECDVWIAHMNNTRIY